MKFAHVRVEVRGATLNVSMFSLIATAKKFLEAGRIVVAQESHQDGGWHPVGKYLACLSIELSLKAFLRLNGETMQNVENFQHRITELLARARKENLREFAKLTGPELRKSKRPRSTIKSTSFDIRAFLKSPALTPTILRLPLFSAPPKS